MKSVIRSSSPQFVHLKVHSAYSLLEGALPIAKLGKLAAANQFPALAITDTNNLFGALEFSEKLWSAGVQPIVGCTLDVDFGDNRDTQPSVAPSSKQRAARQARRKTRAAGDECRRLRQSDAAFESALLRTCV